MTGVDTVVTRSAADVAAEKRGTTVLYCSKLQVWPRLPSETRMQPGSSMRR